MGVPLFISITSDRKTRPRVVGSKLRIHSLASGRVDSEKDSWCLSGSTNASVTAIFSGPNANVNACTL